MFDIIAPRYDTFTRLFSYGMDASWKERLLTFTGDRHFSRGLDLACGTGDLLERFLRDSKVVRAVGVDLSVEMAIVAHSRVNVQGGDVLLGDLAYLPIASNCVDVVTVGYGFRNAAQFDSALQEAYRVLRPGGMLLVLDFYRSPSRVWHGAFRTYLAVAGSIFGLILHGEGEVYRYIAASIDHYLTADAFECVLSRVGFSTVVGEQRLFGAIALHAAVKGCV